jgi:DNA polymerase-3 subunit beta
VKLSSSKRELYEGLQSVTRAVSGRSTLPILSNVMLEAKEGRLRLLATDLEIWMECSVPVEMAQGGAITLPAKVVSEVVGSLPEAKVELQGEEGKAVTISCGHSQYVIQGMAAEEFPSPPRVGKEVTMQVGQGAFKDAVRSVILAASMDETRLILTGVLLTWDGQVLKLAATDHHRLAVNSVAAEGDQGKEVSVIVPSRALAEVLRALSAEAEEKLTITIGDNQIMFRLDGLVVTSRLIDGQFPNYERVIPTESDKRVTADRGELAAAVKRAAIVARTEANKVMLRSSRGVLSIEATSGEVGQAHEEVAIELEGEDLEIAFNAEYLMDVLAVLDSQQVQLGLTGPLSPGVIRPGDDSPYLYVVMPMQMSG